MKTQLCIAGFWLALNAPAWAGLYGFGTLSPGGGAVIGAIPESDTTGLPNSLSVSGESSSLSGLTLTFVLQGGFASDLSGYPRLGNTETSPAYILTSLIQSQTLSESSANTYAVDFSTPGFSTAFSGQNPNRFWTLYFADPNTGGTTYLNGWSLDITAVPEPANVGGSIFIGLLVSAKLARRARIWFSKERLPGPGRAW